MTTHQTIAIVDDDEGVRTSLSNLLRSFGYDVDTYGSGVEFLEKGRDRPADCIITDVQMPHMRGDELQNRLIETGSTTPMIFMTAFPTEAIRGRVMEAGARAFLEKPVETALLLRHIEDAVA
ncbi:two-component response regulator [Devosia sp. H5989]|uniref:Response regulator n=1 Tax=Paradevosia tibetensis TaxID=1447062 RepID=A0A5B9DLQ4_9HYPH|nr:response regulator [Youhaiella tibetensis]AKR55088.1 two-component response regulator [Devosia sp. H5989]QEE20190.1 response regulator [Youhaiella tibetensis]